MRRVKQVMLTVVGGAVAVLIACDGWPIWDSLFDREEVGAKRGWTGGDGGISAELPGGRRFWIFGDSYLTSYVNGQRPQLTRGVGEAFQHVTFGNTVAIQHDSDPGQNDITFYARLAGELTEVMDEDDNGAEYTQVFDQEKLTGEQADPEAKRYFWPLGAECIKCAEGAQARLYLSFLEFSFCDIVEEPNPKHCLSLCEEINQAGQCRLGIKFLNNLLVGLKNIQSDDIDEWEVDGRPRRFRRNNHSYLWGTSFLEADDYVYIYGWRPVQEELHVQRIPATGKLTDRWEAWRTVSGQSAWSSNGGLPSIPVAKGVPSLSTVDKVSRDGKTRYLLTHSRNDDHLLYARVTKTSRATNTESSAATWSDIGATTPRLDLTSIDSSLAHQLWDLIARADCPVDFDGAIPRYDCGMSYHGMAHMHTTWNDSLGPQWVMASYVVPWGPNPSFDPSEPESQDNPPTGGQSTAFYRPKFTLLPIFQLKPWCTSDCWQGIVHKYLPRAVGSSPVHYQYDVTSVTGSRRFNAQAVRNQGTVDMTLDYYDGLMRIGSTSCALTDGIVVKCDVTPPSGADWLQLTVSGDPSDTYSLQVHRAGYH